MIFGTDARSATEASRTPFAEPSVLSRLVRRVGPTPGIWSSTEAMALAAEAKALHDAGKHAESVAKADEAAKAINLTLKKK